MHGTQLVSCSNCWFNGLQYGTVGLSMGYCAEYKVVLRRADESTCGKHVRKDLMLTDALAQQTRHQRHFERLDGVQVLHTRHPVENGAYLEADSSMLRRDAVGDAAADYGELGSKIESLAVLKAQKSFRGDLAMLSLGRAYVRRCRTRQGRWTSGLHMFRWTRQRLESDPRPELGPEDLRVQTAASLERQVELAQWGLVMLRLVFISDLGSHAIEDGDPVSSLANLAEEAAAESGALTIKKLANWVKGEGLKRIDAALSEARIKALAAELHEPRD
ncbi:MAG: hypothetical protein H6732_13025 [Alphaproteobacteria bacterium]|nr:hypothetical protein [Alphaproteobacteria bacterium]